MIKRFNLVYKSLVFPIPKSVNLFNFCGFATNGKRITAGKLLEGCGIMGSYANALFLTTEKAGNLSEVMSDLKFISNSLVTCEDFRTFMTTPGLRTSQKMKFLREDFGTLGSPLQPQTLNCLEMLFEQKRSAEFLTLAKHFETLFLRANNQLKCLVQSAEKLTAEAKERITEALRHRLGNSCEPVVEFKVTPSILGGLLVNVGDKVVDTSVASKLERIQSHLRN
ncbi:ATP synthase delta (OSCP) subunit family protein [Theileria parva strain Muguga]|uniref:ATP synthase delta chain, mitochondrial, putative n=1 Tax=Theileria parva TaxID=5875 RepID=Q4N791_THEPA|nr:ATP synthase subunit delta, mitochondrial precursor [Theileria parva strain Muguga]EAN34167.1 ATP synthase delta (OSCP) subunit family protein [Theileria parva strain Muguga]|eukprot:XP_766450.1 ATP synthase subunit delta, mitochondrial precursor [Theileria parva strain Muguga]